MKGLMILAFMFVSTVSMAIDAGDVEKVINDMVKEGIISQNEASNAKLKLKNISKEQWQQIEGLANRKIASQQGANPVVDRSAKTAADRIDFDSKEFKSLSKEVESILKDKK